MTSTQSNEPKPKEISWLAALLLSFLVFVIPRERKTPWNKLEKKLIDALGRVYTQRKVAKEFFKPEAAKFETSDAIVRLLAWWEHCWTHGIRFSVKPNGEPPNTAAAQSKLQGDIQAAQSTKIARIAGIISAITAGALTVTSIIFSPDARAWLFSLDWHTGLALLVLAIMAVSVSFGCLNAMRRSLFDQESISEANFLLSVLETQDIGADDKSVPYACAQAVGTITGSGGTLGKATGQQLLIGFSCAVAAAALCWFARGFIPTIPAWMPWLSLIIIYLLLGTRLDVQVRAHSWNRRMRVDRLARICKISEECIPESLLTEYREIKALKLPSSNKQVDKKKQASVTS